MRDEFSYKFSRSNVAYPSYHVQAQTYGVLLENMGFDTSRLFYAIVVAKSKDEGKQRAKTKRGAHLNQGRPKGSSAFH